MMKKSTCQVDPVHEIENNPPMSEMNFIIDPSASKPKKHKKKNSKDGKLRAKKEVCVTLQQRENGVPVISSLKRLHISQQQKKKKKLKKNMGSPIIVEATTGEYPTIPLPVSLRQAAILEPPLPAVSLGSFGMGKKKHRNKALKKTQITVAECINPSPEKQSRKMVKTKHMVSAWEETVEKTAETPGNEHDFASPAAAETSAEFVEPMEENLSSSYFEDVTETNVAQPPVASLSSNENPEEIESQQLPRFYSFRDKVLAIIEPDCKFAFHGKLRVRVLYGAIKVYGVLLNSAKTQTPLEIFSPRAYSPVAVEATESEVPDRNLTSIWQSLGDQCTDRKLAKRLQSDISNVDDGWAIVELINFDNELTNFLANYCPFRLFPRVDDPSNHSWRDARRAEIVLQANLRFIDPCKQLTIGSREIDDIAEGICYDWETKDSSRTVIAGGKSVGKSTTARYIVNKLLAKSKAVVFLDLDPGQGEFTPAGCISLNIVEEPLLGPNFTHLRTPYYQIYVGSTDVTRCFTHYIDGIKQLVDRMSEDTRLMCLPLVVNTMGFCKGIGWDIINYVIKVVLPTDVIQILSRRSKNNFEDTLSRQVVDRQSLGSITWTKDTAVKDRVTKHRLHVAYSEAETGSGTIESWNLEPHQQRELVLIAYLSQIVGRSGSSSALPQSRALAPSINAVPPYTVPFSAMSVSLAGAFIPQVLSVMNGNVVALCGVDIAETTEESRSEENIIAGYPRVLIRPPLHTCYGFGILRGVDMEKEQLFINTPLSAAHMRHVNCLVGCVNVPSGLLQLNRQGAPYTGSEYDLPTSREPRRGYFRTRFQTDT